MPKIVVILLAAALGLVGCTHTGDDEKMADTVQVSEQWASAADDGMTAVFGTVTNTGRRDAHVVSATSPAARRVELHEVVGAGGGSKTMRPKEDGFIVPAGGSHQLVPGGDHLMLMDLTAPLQPGADVPVTLRFEDGSSLPVTAQVRDAAGGDENYGSPPHHHG